MEPRRLHDLLHDDHERSAGLLDATGRGEWIDDAPIRAFRAGLPRHIAMKEKNLLAAIKQLSGGESLPFARRLNLDHSALPALLVPAPTSRLVE